MLANRLQYKITIEKKTTVKTAAGDLTEHWKELKQVWADRKYISGTEIFSRGVQNTTSVDFVIRYTNDIDYNCRIIDAGTTYDINSIEQINRREGLRIKCNRIKNG